MSDVGRIKAPVRPGAGAPDLAAGASAVERLLRDQLQDYRRLLACVRRKRDAIAHADVDQLEQVSAQEGHLLEQCAQREPRRRELLEQLARGLDPATATLTVRELAERVEEPARSRLLGLAAELRETAATARRESSIVRTAAEALSRHLVGVMQTMHTALGRAQVYGRGGSIAAGAQVRFSVDVRT